MSEQNTKKIGHVAFIMDGNGRWARSRGLPISLGHKEGTEALSRVLEHCQKLEIKYATVYALSTENLKRPKDEVEYLLSLFKDYIDKMTKSAQRKNVRIIFIGDLSPLGSEYEEKARTLERITKNHEYTAVIAVNYGARAEMVRAVKALIEDGKNPIEITEEDISQRLYTKDIPEPDLIIRTAGEKRLSNFLLWQAAYSEFYFTDTLWPDFGAGDLDAALCDYYKRKRNFGVKHQ